MKTNRLLNFFYHLFDLVSCFSFFHQFKSLFSKKSQNQSKNQSKIKKSTFSHVIKFHLFSNKSGNGRFFFVIKNRSLGSKRRVITVSDRAGKKKIDAVTDVISLR